MRDPQAWCASIGLMTTINLDHAPSVTSELQKLLNAGVLYAPSLIVLASDEDGLSHDVITIVDDMPTDPPQHDRIQVLGTIGRAVKSAHAVGALLGVRRAGAAAIRGNDLAWHDAFDTAMRAEGLHPHGAYLITDHDVERIVPEETSAA